MQTDDISLNYRPPPGLLGHKQFFVFAFEQSVRFAFAHFRNANWITRKELSVKILVDGNDVPATRFCTVKINSFSRGAGNQ